MMFEIKPVDSWEVDKQFFKSQQLIGELLQFYSANYKGEEFLNRVKEFLLKFFKSGSTKILVCTIQLLYSKFFEMNYQMIKGGHPEPLLKFVIDHDLIAASDLIK
jgi:hypothetical protein